MKLNLLKKLFSGESQKNYLNAEMLADETFADEAQLDADVEATSATLPVLNIEVNFPPTRESIQNTDPQQDSPILAVQSRPPLPFYDYPCEALSDLEVEPMTLRSAIEVGRLCPIFIEWVDIEIDLRKVGIIGKDFDQRELDKLIWENASDIAEEIYKNGHKLLPDGKLKFRPTIVFTPHVDSAESIVAALCDVDIKAACISCGSPDGSPDLDPVYKQFKSGELECLVSVATLQEGFYAPWIEMVALACPSMSIETVTQKIERGILLSPQTGKEDCKILEFIGQTNPGQELVGALDIILGDSPLPHNAGEDAKTPKAEAEAQKEMAQKMKDRAQSLLDSGDAFYAIEAVDLARELIEEENKLERERKLEAGRAKYQRGVQKKAQMRARVNPFAQTDDQSSTPVTAGLPVVPRGGRRVRDTGGDFARPEQLQRMRELSGGTMGHASHNVSAAEACRYLAILETRHRLGLASQRQVQTLIQNGIDSIRANAMSAKQAETIINSLKSRKE